MFGHIHANGPYLSVPHALLERTFILTIVEGNSRKLLTFVPGIIRGVEKRATFRGYSGTPRDSCYWQGGRGVLLREYKMDPSLPDEDITTWEILYDCLISSTIPLSKFADTPAYPPSTDKSALVKQLLDMDAVKACFRRHHPDLAEKLDKAPPPLNIQDLVELCFRKHPPEIAERLDAAPGPIKIEELLPFKS